jgi:hypothetical protein
VVKSICHRNRKGGALTSEASHLRALRGATARVEKAQEDRDEAIRRAYQDGLGPSVIAGAVGLTRQRVHQIVKEGDK